MMSTNKSSENILNPYSLTDLLYMLHISQNPFKDSGVLMRNSQKNCTSIILTSGHRPLKGLIHIVEIVYTLTFSAELHLYTNGRLGYAQYFWPSCALYVLISFIMSKYECYILIVFMDRRVNTTVNQEANNICSSAVDLISLLFWNTCGYSHTFKVKAKCFSCCKNTNHEVYYLYPKHKRLSQKKRHFGESGIL